MTVSSRIIGLDQEMFPWPQTCEGEQQGQNGDHSKGQHFALCVCLLSVSVDIISQIEAAFITFILLFMI